MIVLVPAGGNWFSNHHHHRHRTCANKRDEGGEGMEDVVRGIEAVVVGSDEVLMR